VRVDVDLSGVRVVVLPVIRGLVSERSRVHAAVSEISPSAIGLSISPEDLAALRADSAAEPGPRGSAEEAYLVGLSLFGDVDTLLGCFTAAIAVAERLGIPVHALDMGEPEFASAYMHAVSGWEFLRSGARAAKMVRWRPRADSPESFVLAWDARVHGSRGLRELQRRREAHIARRIREIAPGRSPVLALVDVERSRGVVDAMRSYRPR